MSFVNEPPRGASAPYDHSASRARSRERQRGINMTFAGAQVSHSVTKYSLKVNKCEAVLFLCLSFLIFAYPKKTYSFLHSESSSSPYKKVLKRPTVTDHIFSIKQKRMEWGVSVVSEFERKYGTRWRFVWDKLLLVPLLALGEGIYLLDEGMTLAEVERRTREFVDANQRFLGVASSDLLLDEKGTHNTGRDREMWLVQFQQIYKGVPVVNSNIFFRFKFGRLVQFGSEAFPDIDIDVQPAIVENRALKLASDAISYKEGLDQTNSFGALRIYPVLEGTKYSYKLAYENRFFKSDPYGEWVVYVDAENGMVLEKFTSTYFFLGLLKGLVHPRRADDSYLDVPLENVFVNASGRDLLTDQYGIFGEIPSDVSQVTVNMAGPKAVSRQCGTVYVSGGKHARCESVETRVVFMKSDDWGSADSVSFRLDDDNTTSPGRDAFYHVNRAINWARQFIEIDWFEKELDINVNVGTWVAKTPYGEKIASVACNALWDGRSIYFFERGLVITDWGWTGCNNAANVADIVFHEWGHGLDANTGGIDDPSFSEGIADTVSFMMTGDHKIGVSFFSEPVPIRGGTYLREVDTDRVYPQDASGEPHDDGLIISGTWWDLRSSLIEEYGEEEGARLASNLFLNHIFAAKKYTDSYAATLFVDDDDGDLANGTPNKDIIDKVFGAHGLTVDIDPHI